MKISNFHVNLIVQAPLSAPGSDNNLLYIGTYLMQWLNALSIHKYQRSKGEFLVSKELHTLNLKKNCFHIIEFIFLLVLFFY